MPAKHQPWVVVALLSGVAGASVMLLVLLLPSHPLPSLGLPPYWPHLCLGAGLLITLFVLMRNPAVRYLRAYSMLIGFLIAANTLPEFHLQVSSEHWGARLIQEGTPWHLNIVLGGLAAVLMVLDYFTHRPPAPSREEEPGTLTSQTAPLELPDKPSIAVLPFVNMSDDPEQEYFSDGMTEDLITDLSVLSGLFVIARNSAFTYKGRAVKPAQVRRELGVRYMLEGSVRKANDRVRITVQLVDAMTGYNVWAERYDRDLQDILAVQKEIARRITRALAVRLTPEEAEHMGRPYTDSVEAWDYFMRGAEHYRRSTKEGNAQARALFENAISLDPAFARAYALLAATHRQDWTFAWSPNPPASEAEAYRLAQHAVELSRQEPEPKPSLPYALQQWAYVLLYRRQHQEASKAVEEAVQRNPNYADGYAVWAQVLIYQGQPQDAIDRMKIAMRLNPKYPAYYDFQLGQAYYVCGYLTEETDANASRDYYRQAEAHLREALRRNNNYRSAGVYLAAVLSVLDRQEEAKAEMVRLQGLGRPQASQDRARFEEYVQQTHPYENPAITSHLIRIWEVLES
jgi:adenylate cyclase